MRKLNVKLLALLVLMVFIMAGCKSKDNVESVNSSEDSVADEDDTKETKDNSKETDVASIDGTTDENSTTGDDGVTQENSDTTKNDEGKTDSTNVTNGTTSNNQSSETNKSTEKGTTTGTGTINKDTYLIATNKFNIDVGVSVHDPSIIKANGKYYIFGSHLAQASTTNLGGTWTNLGVQGYANKTLYGNALKTALAEPLKWAGSKGDADHQDSEAVWAPDVIYNPNYKWSDGSKGAYMLYSCTSATYIRSAIFYCVSKNIEGPYTYVDTIIYSGFTKSDSYDASSSVNKNVANTNVYDIRGNGNTRASYFNSNGSYNNGNFPNAIDPNMFFDANGQLWMTYGSWSGGIWILKLDSATGQPIHDYADSSANGLTDKYFGKLIAGGRGVSGEAPYVLYDKASGYYYLFVSYGWLEADGGYNIRIFRSKTADGPYTDATGVIGTGETTGVKLIGGYKFPSLKNGYLSPGHNSAFIDTDGKFYVVYHTRFENLGGWHQPRVHQMFKNAEGWLCATPFQTTGETISSTGYSNDKLSGTYYVVMQTNLNNTTAAQYKQVVLGTDGKVTGAYAGTWSATNGTAYMTITVSGVKYSGVFVNMKDEAGNDCMVFTSVGTNNYSLWGVKYQ